MWLVETNYSITNFGREVNPPRNTRRKTYYEHSNKCYKKRTVRQGLSNNRYFHSTVVCVYDGRRRFLCNKSGTYISYIVLGFWVVILTLMQSLGRASKASVLVLLRQIVIYIPAAFIMPHVAGLGVHGVFCAPLITDAIVLIVVIWMMCSEFKRMDQLKAANR